MNTGDGILIVDKPQGWTSHDVVQKTRNLLCISKVGHTGTLDPMATGVLVLLLGKATKLARFFENDDKRYLAEITFGRSTDTFDSTGKTTATGDPAKISLDNLDAIIKDFKGEHEQIPPMFSALKVGGKRLYQLAREGKTIQRQPRKITISSIESDISGFPRIMLDIKCSKGTYIRALSHQLGVLCNCPAHLSALRRTASGKYTLKDAVDFKSLVETGGTGKLEQYIIPMPDQETRI